MNLDQAVISFSALSQDTRLRVLKLLIEYGRDGAAAGFIGEQLGIAHNTLSFHLSQLSHAGLVGSRKQGRSVIYSASNEMIEELISYLRENCCVREEQSSTCIINSAPKPRKKAPK